MTSAGVRYHIESPDHAGINPQNSRAIVWFDDGTWVVVSGMQIAAIEMERPQAA